MRKFFDNLGNLLGLKGLGLHFSRVFILFLSSSLHSEGIVIGIAGGTASGKSTLAEKVKRDLFPHATIVSLDAYGIEMPFLALEERMRFNWDSPEAVDVDLVVKQLSDLKKGLCVEQPVPKLDTYSREPFTITVNSAPIIIIEGLHVLSIPKIRDLIDIKIFIEVDDDIRLLRRIERDIQNRGGDLSSLLSQYLENIKPMHDLYIQPSMQYADFVITQLTQQGIEKSEFLINNN